MTDRTALAELIEALEAGKGPDTISGHTIMRAVGLDHVKLFMIALDPDDMRALGAALALHEAVLPGWWWAIEPETVGGHTSVGHHSAKRGPFFGQAMDGTSHAPARAFLLAILKALQAQETP